MDFASGRNKILSADSSESFMKLKMELLDEEENDEKFIEDIINK